MHTSRGSRICIFWAKIRLAKLQFLLSVGPIQCYISAINDNNNKKNSKPQEQRRESQGRLWPAAAAVLWGSFSSDKKIFGKTKTETVK